MTSLRQRMLEDMRIRNFTQNTQRSYLEQVSRFARHFGRSPEELGPEEVRAYQIYLLEVRKLSAGSRGLAASALRFLYKVTLKREWSVEYIPLPKQPTRLPVILSPEEVGCFLNAVGNLKHRVLLAVAYAAGLRVSEVTHLKVGDIDSKRMVLRVEQGKNQKDRYVMLSPELLERLRVYWKIARPQDWLFPGNVAGRPITRSAVERVCQQARRRCGIQSRSRRIRCVTRSPPTCSRAEPMCGPFSCCSVTAAWRRLRATSSSPPARCAPPAAPSTCCPSQLGPRVPTRPPLISRSGVCRARPWRWPTSSVATLTPTGKPTPIRSHAASAA